MSGFPDDPTPAKTMADGAPKAIHLFAVPIGADACADAVHQTRFFTGAAGAEAVAARLAILIEELVMNLIDHGGAPAGDPIAIRLAAHDAGVRVTIEDGGAPFDPRGAAPTFDPDRIGGAGLVMLDRWAEIEDYASAGGRNRLVLFVRG